MAISEIEFDALVAKVANNERELLTIKNSFIILEQTVNSRYELAMSEIAKLKNDVAALIQKDEELNLKVDSINKSLDGIGVKITVDRFKINRLNRRRKGLL